MVVSNERPPCTAHMLLPAPAQEVQQALRQRTGEGGLSTGHLALCQQQQADGWKLEGASGNGMDCGHTPRWQMMRLSCCLGLSIMRAAS